MMKKILLFALLSLSLASQIFAHSPNTSDLQLPAILEKAMPAVVNIGAQGTLPESNDTPEKQTDERKFVSLGSGVIIQTVPDKNKTIDYIVTNAHVITNASVINVSLNDGRQYMAEKVGEDKAFDIAILKIISKQPLSTLPFGDSNAIKIGETVTAIGSPFGLKESVTSGIISATNRSQPELNSGTNYIQTDAPINQGNSGGALINMKGELIGINTSIVSESHGGNLGIGFAIPANIVRAVATQLIENNKVERGQLGLMVQSMTPELAEALGVSEVTGAFVTTVKTGSPAEKDGLIPGDIITKLNQQIIHNNSELAALVSLHRPGHPFTLTILRQGKAINLNVSTESPETLLNAERKANPYLFGTTYRNFSEYTTGEGTLNGVQLIRLNTHSNAANAGLLPGDIITAVNQHKIENILQLQEAVDHHQKEILLLSIDRDGANLLIPISKEQAIVALGNL